MEEVKAYNFDKRGEVYACCNIGEDGGIYLVVSKLTKQEFLWRKPQQQIRMRD